ncbi:putative V-type proton ATPase subunit H-like [Capsicum annuum]|uniref:zeatin O-glucosyltransferase n=1 Tax=Capsicum annuum TaxID=4072 RepID=UPI0007BFBCF9|nr:zeatin O-glucosyltransferase [Capsicum annuum]KAF3648097.1 putative V-type proton ATPase subunit H-like [Capsicum annuum]KAF3677107.1 putative V-type proton ATPase subunit H-like [Capsicum annuum]
MATNSSHNSLVHLNEVTVAMVPWPEHGHLNLLFYLARIIASHNIPVHFICLSARNQDLRKRLRDGLQISVENLGDSNIRFNDLLVPSTPTETKDVFLERLGESICRTCHELSTNTKRLVIVHDCLMMSYIGDHLHLMSNFKCYAFHPTSAFTRYSAFGQTIHIVDEDHEEMIQQLGEEFPTVESTFGLNMAEHVGKELKWKHNSGDIINSCRELEGKFIDSLGKVKENTPLWAFGPFNMMPELIDSLSNFSSGNKRTSHKCLEFLHKQDVNSVIFVSFGTTTTLSQEQVKELALGLEQSNHKFIWVIREADKRVDMENSEERHEKILLPERFEERVEGRGMVVRSWAPQLEILGHPSTGGFLSHCGWNSSMESISMGVPMAAMPMAVDQPYHTLLVTNVWKIGISVWSWARRKEIVPAAAIEKAVKTLMGTSEGEEMRQRVVELRDSIKNSASHGGLSHKEMESFISYITKN